MKRILLIPLLVLNASSILANTLTEPKLAFIRANLKNKASKFLTKCWDQANHPELVDIRPIGNDCLTAIAEFGSPQTLKRTRGGQLAVIAGQGIVFFWIRNCPDYLQGAGGECRHLLSGSQTQLNQIQVLDLVKEPKLLALLDSASGLMLFRLPVNGNVPPAFKLQDKDIQGATDLAVSDQRNELYLLNSEQNKIHVYEIAKEEVTPFPLVKKGEIPLAPLKISADRLAISENESSLFLADRKGALLHQLSFENKWKLLKSIKKDPEVMMNTQAIDALGSSPHSVRYWSEDGQLLGNEPLDQP